ncbi:MAG: nucleotidyltransferase domain-containing protein [Candidatus Zixiibacteriota bacterium]|nr:MAG: nucleotidyltransferase domain-containing protein [candidate division Zixibacteria bacterium]
MTKTEVEKLLESFVSLMKETYAENLVFIIHHGSWATGEAKPDSDVDTLIMLQKITKKELDKLRRVLNQERYKKMTVLLFSRLDMDNFIPFSRHQFHYGAKVLYGECRLPKPTREEMIIEIKKIADEVGFWSKFLYTHPHLAENVARKMYWRFKEAIIALKVYVQWKTGEFPLTKTRLKDLLVDPKDKEIVTIIERWDEKKEKYEKNPSPLLIKGLDFSQRILKRIDPSLRGKRVKPGR